MVTALEELVTLAPERPELERALTRARRARLVGDRVRD